jgi:hypothetical protein
MSSSASRFVEFCVAHVAVIIAAAVGDRSIRLQSSTDRNHDSHLMQKAAAAAGISPRPTRERAAAAAAVAAATTSARLTGAERDSNTSGSRMGASWRQCEQAARLPRVGDARSITCGIGDCCCGAKNRIYVIVVGQHASHLRALW